MNVKLYNFAKDLADVLRKHGARVVSESGDRIKVWLPGPGMQDLGYEANGYGDVLADTLAAAADSDMPLCYRCGNAVDEHGDVWTLTPMSCRYVFCCTRCAREHQRDYRLAGEIKAVNYRELMET